MGLQPGTPLLVLAKKFCIIFCLKGYILSICWHLGRTSNLFYRRSNYSLWWVSSSSEQFRLPEWWEGIIALGHGLFRERSPVSSRFSESLFLDVPGTATEQVRTCGFRRKSLSLDKAPKIRDSVRLNSFESFLVTLPSISSETWEMYSCASSGSSVFCDWLFLVFSRVFLETAAKILLIVRVAMILRAKSCQLWRLNWSCIFYNKSVGLFWLWGKSFNQDKKVNDFNKRYNARRLRIYIITIVLSFLPFLPFLSGKYNCLHAKSRYKYRKVF